MLWPRRDSLAKLKQSTSSKPVAYNLGGCSSARVQQTNQLRRWLPLIMGEKAGCPTRPLVAAPNQQGQRAQRAHQHGVGLPRAQRQHRAKQGRHIQGRPRYRWQGRLCAVRSKPCQHNINKRKAHGIQRSLPHGPAQSGQQNHAPRRSRPLAATPAYHGIHHGVELYALAQLAPAGRVSRHHGQNKRQQGQPRLIKPKVSA